MISLTLFSRLISCWAFSSVRFFICLSWSISLLICPIRRSTISLPSIVSSRSKLLSSLWSLSSIIRNLMGAFSHPISSNISSECFLQGNCYLLMARFSLCYTDIFVQRGHQISKEYVARLMKEMGLPVSEALQNRTT